MTTDLYFDFLGRLMITLIMYSEIFRQKSFQKNKKGRARRVHLCQGIFAKKPVNTPFVPSCANRNQCRGTPIIR